MQYTLSILVENQAGVLSKISGLFSRRGFNIDSLAVGVTQDPSVSRITIVANGDEYIVEQLEKQLNKLIDVIKVRHLPNQTADRVQGNLSQTVAQIISSAHHTLNAEFVFTKFFLCHFFKKLKRQIISGKLWDIVYEERKLRGVHYYVPMLFN